MKRIAKTLLSPLIPDRYTKIFCVIGGLVMVFAGILLIFSGYHGLLFLLLGLLCIASVLARKTP